MEENIPIVKRESSGLPQNNPLVQMLKEIRPVWRTRPLIERVRRLLPVDPSSACQRLFNASIHDLREKIKVAGLDIAKQAAELYGLPPIGRVEDIDEYRTARIIDLCYRMGLISRSEWRKVKRVYDIRRDLEHEDDDYEAGLEDCIYIFTTCIGILSRDPVQLLKVTDVKDIVEKPNAIIPTNDLLQGYQSAYKIRQKEILLYLVSVALDDTKPDIVRQNCFEFLKLLEPITHNEVKIEMAEHIQERMGRQGMLDLIHARISYACGALPYLKLARIKDFFERYYKKLEKVGYRWDKYKEHGPLLEEFQDIGGFEYCPEKIRPLILKWMIFAYIGERGGYGYYGSRRPVFYSNTASPIIEEIIKNSDSITSEDIRKFSGDKDIKLAMSDKHVGRRFEELDISENVEIK